MCCFKTANFGYVNLVDLLLLYCIVDDCSTTHGIGPFLYVPRKENTEAITPILLDYYNYSTNAVLNVSFQQCDFIDNRFKGYPAQAAVIVGNGNQNLLTVSDSSFLRNDMVYNNTNVSELSVPAIQPGNLARDFNLNSRRILFQLAVEPKQLFD